MCTNDLERVLEACLARQRRSWHPPRYEVRPCGEGTWAIVDCDQERERGGKVVRVTSWLAIAQSAALFGNMLGQCDEGGCDHPAVVLCLGRSVCIDHLPPGELYALIPVEVLRAWRASEYR